MANTIKANLGWYINNNANVENVLHFTVGGGPPSASQCAALAADFQAAQLTYLKPLVNTENGCEPCTVTDISSSSGAQGVGGTQTGGSESGSFNSAQTCVCVNHHIAQRYRGGKPRSYLPLGNQGALLTPGQWSSTFLTAVNTAWADFITNCLAATTGGVSVTAFVAVSYYHAKAVRATPVTYPVVNSTARQTVSSQRRRIKGA